MILRLEVSVYNIYITNQFLTTFATGGRGGEWRLLFQLRARIPPLYYTLGQSSHVLCARQHEVKPEEESIVIKIAKCEIISGLGAEINSSRFWLSHFSTAC